MTTPREPQPPFVVGFDLDMTLVDPATGRRRDLPRASAPRPASRSTASSRPPGWGRCSRSSWPSGRRPSGSRSSPSATARTSPPSASRAPACCPARPRRSPRSASEGGRIGHRQREERARGPATVERLGLAPDEVVGWIWGPDKGEALRERGASVYVGDHTGDMLAARTAGATAVAVGDRRRQRGRAARRWRRRRARRPRASSRRGCRRTCCRAGSPRSTTTGRPRLGDGRLQRRRRLRVPAGRRGARARTGPGRRRHGGLAQPAGRRAGRGTGSSRRRWVSGT